MSLDTSADALEVQRGVWRRLGPSGRMRLALEMSEEVQRVALAGIKTRHPELDADGCRRLLARQLYGVEATRVGHRE